MEAVREVVSVLLDAYILITYLKNVLPHFREDISKIWFYAGIAVTELLLQLNMYIYGDSLSEMRMVVTTGISLITTFLLCLFFEGRVIYNAAVSVIFQIMALLSEKICVMISVMVSGPGAQTGYPYEITMNLMTKIIMLIMTIILSFVRKRQQEQPLEYNVLMLFTPIFSMLVLIVMPMNSDYVSDNLIFFFVIWIYIAVINIVHSFLVEKLAGSYRAQMQASELETQITYQKQKYLQLGESYKKSRRIIHDIKHHNEALKKYISQGRYDELCGYLSSYTNDLESSYIMVNTGNLVIDALITSYIDMADSRKIKFSYSLNVDNDKIPVSDYDLCIILGNLLDNSLNACEKLSEGELAISVTIASKKSYQFIIAVQNTYERTSPDRHSDFQHGYGLDNVRRAVRNCHGLMQTDAGDLFRVTIIIPVTDSDKRIINS